MSVAKVSPCQKLWHLPLRTHTRPTILALALPSLSPFSTTPRLSASRTLIPDECKQFLRPDGRLSTTKDNLDFLSKYNLEHDTAQCFYLKSGPDLNALFAKFGLALLFCPRHLIQPSNIKYLDPRGHPLADAQKAKLAHKATTQPLWIVTTCRGGPKATVRITATRRLRSSIYAALEARGYDRYGNGRSDGAKGDLKGTLWIRLQDSEKAVGEDKKLFGPAVVEKLEEMILKKKKKNNSNYSDNKRVATTTVRRKDNLGWNDSSDCKGGTAPPRTFRPRGP